MPKCALIVLANTQYSTPNTYRLFLTRIADAGMIDGLEFLDEHRLGILDVAESNGAFAEITLGHLGVDDTLYLFADGLFGIVLQRA